jgi:hypothetical protein
MNYFQQFPTINYNEHQVRNILARVKLTEVLNSTQLTYFDYQLDEGDQAWIIADQYYGSVDRTWLVYLSNNIIDPFYEWYMDTFTFENYITKKYGSLSAAKANLIGYNEVIDGEKTGIKFSPTSFTYSTDINKSNWTPIYSYDEEDEANEARRSIKLLSNKYADLAETNLKDLLSNG